MSESQIIKKDSILKIQKTMEHLRTKNETLNKEMNSILEQSTKTEKENLENAIKKYNEKVEKVLQTDEIKDRLEKKQDCEEKMYNLVDKVKNSFRKAVKEIRNQPISNKEKNDRIKQLSESIENALLSNRERDLMKIIKSQLGSLPYQSIKFIC